MIDSRELKRIIADNLRDADFDKKGLPWFYRGVDAIAVVNLQRSDFGLRYYINIDFYLSALGNERFSKENECHIQLRATSVFPEKRELVDRACSLEDADQAALEELRDFLRDEVIPFARQCTALETLAKCYPPRIADRGLVFKEVRELLAGR